MVQERILVPNIGDTRDVDVVEILVQPGLRVEREQPLIVLESEKASMEVPSPRAGVVRELSLKVGDKVSEGSPILLLDLDDEDTSTTASEAKARSAPPQPSQMRETSGNGAQAAAQGAPSSDATRAAGERDASPQSAPDQQAIALSAAQPSAARSTTDALSGPTRTLPPGRPVSRSEPPKPPARLPYAGPAVRHLARELGVDLSQVEGSAARARITKDDVQRYVKHTMTVAMEPRGLALDIGDAPEIDFSQFGEVSEQPLTKIQRVSGKNLHRSWVTIPHVTQFDEADITELEDFRKKIRGEHKDVKLTLVTFFMKAVVSALKSMPRFNSSLDKSGEKLIIKHYFHIGVAVDTPNGLMVPVIRDVDLKSLGQLARELEEVSERARARRLGPADLQGASITISSLGGIGGTAFTPIINPPEVAVLGVSRARWRPVYQGGAFVPRLLCPLSLSYDHRVIDGADAARFTTRLGEILGDIRQMLL